MEICHCIRWGDRLLTRTLHFGQAFCEGLSHAFIIVAASPLTVKFHREDIINMGCKNIEPTTRDVEELIGVP